MALVDNAFAYAARGWAVFPLVRGTKKPATTRGFKDASTDSERIGKWWTEDPDFNIGVACGASGLFVVDLDVKGGNDGRKAWAEIADRNGAVPTYTVVTASNGLHLYFENTAPPLRNGKNGQLAPGIDTRGDGGYVVAAGSVVDGREYRQGADLPVAPVPTWLPEALRVTQEPRKSVSVPAGGLLVPAAPGAVLARIHELAQRLAQAPDGEGNDTLKDAAAYVGQYVGAGQISREEAEGILRDAISRWTYEESADYRRMLNTLEKQVDWGIKNPRPWTEMERVNALDLLNVPMPATQAVLETGGTEQLPVDSREEVWRMFPAVDFAALWDAQDEEEWIVYPLLPARRLVALYSPPKVGKSLVMLEIAAGIATGRDALGNSAKPARHVLYVDFENDPRGDTIERLKAMGYKRDDVSALQEHLHVLSFPSMAALDSPQGGQQLMAAVIAYGAEVVVIDTISRAVDGDENSNDTWLGFYRHTGLKLKQARVALIRLDHTGKDEEKGMRGGSAKRGDVDAVWKLSAIVPGSTYKLTCEDARMPVAERELLLTRETDPLRHKVEPRGWMAGADAAVTAIVAAADAAGLPDNAGRTKVTNAAREKGVKVKTANAERAVLIRQARQAICPI